MKTKKTAKRKRKLDLLRDYKIIVLTRSRLLEAAVSRARRTGATIVVQNIRELVHPPGAEPTATYFTKFFKHHHGVTFAVVEHDAAYDAITAKLRRSSRG